MQSRTRDKQLLVRLTNHEKEILDDFCEASGIKKTDLIVDLINKIKTEEYLYGWEK